MIAPSTPQIPRMVAALRDGTRVFLRPIRPDDKARLVDFHRRLSPTSIYLRYLAPKDELSAADLVFLTEVDQLHHAALVVTTGEGDAESILGVGRYIGPAPLPPDALAEVAFVVADAWQGRGAATLLLNHLARIAGESGFSGLEAWVHPDNHPMLDVFRRSGLRRSERMEEGLVHVLLDVLVPVSA